MNSSLFDVVIGLALVFAVFSTLCSVITEWWARIRDQRARQLKVFIEALVGDPKWATNFFEHPLIKGLKVTKWSFFVMGEGKTDLPSYIPPRLFALVLIDLAFEVTDHLVTLKIGKCDDLSKCQLTAGDEPLQARNKLPPKLQVALRALTNGTRNSCQHTQERLENWFTESTARLTGQYTRYAHTVTLVAAMVITLLFNVDIVRVASDLYHHPQKTQAAVSIASKLSPDPDPKAVDKVMWDFNLLDLPLGWSRNLDTSLWGWLVRILGWLLSIGGLSLGAPFWFDTLNRVMRLRQAGTKPSTA